MRPDLTRSARLPLRQPQPTIPPMTDDKAKVGAALRFLASGGWTDEDPDALIELVKQAQTLADMVLADERVSAEFRTAAEAFLARLRSDTYR